ncbi:hypothetical protein, partial [Lentzea sp. NBRC 102530]|uniref:hypothetical protein n=1 Tax=Lentzea sp. NBRC 102530 TaxID=3032201 RepID=UPI002553A0AC
TSGSINAHSASVTSKRATTEFYQPDQHTTENHQDPNLKQPLVRTCLPAPPPVTATAPGLPALI